MRRICTWNSDQFVSAEKGHIPHQLEFYFSDVVQFKPQGEEEEEEEISVSFNIFLFRPVEFLFCFWSRSESRRRLARAPWLEMGGGAAARHLTACDLLIGHYAKR